MKPILMQRLLLPLSLQSLLKAVVCLQDLIAQPLSLLQIMEVWYKVLQIVLLLSKQNA